MVGLVQDLIDLFDRKQNAFSKADVSRIAREMDGKQRALDEEVLDIYDILDAGDRSAILHSGATDI